MFKLISLKASGFKRLDIEDRLLFPDGRLLVVGRNESGKSTLMEAIHYALYGMPLRPSKNAGNEDIICYGRDEAIVELEFSIDDTEYQVRRELYRKKNNIHLLNKREQDGNLSRVTTGARNVNNELNEILHGIDSDALLNSCLVEQKELGKLEDANKQERIKAMSSLLNLEAFVEAKSSLKKEGDDLDKIHSNTLMELQRAEQAKLEYEEAEKRRETAETRLTEIEGEKKEVEEGLGEVDEELEKTQRLTGLLDNLRDTESALENIEVRLSENHRQHNEAAEAKDRIGELNEKIEQYTPVRDALGKIEEISTLFNKATMLRNDAARLETELESTQERLSESKGSEDRIKRLEDQEKEAEAKRGSARNMRTGGVATAVLGLLIILYSASSAIWVGAALGAILLLAGGYLVSVNNPSKFEKEINETRIQREEMLGERSRIQDYYEAIMRLESELQEVKEAQTDTETGITRELNQLPEKPREYRAMVSLTDSTTLNKLRKEIQEDNETLTGCVAEKGSLQKKADSLKALALTLETLQKERQEKASGAELLDNQIKIIEQESGVSREQVEETTRELRTQRDVYLRKSASLEREEQERNNDVLESNQIIEKTMKLKEQYPALEEESKQEEFKIEAMRRATILLDTTRESIMGGVKQNVEKNMMQFLPTLTDNRYNMARIDEANYRIEVYDREAKQWRGKGVFSGATQDQFSLALRLAFAISTIPSSRGARPGFIFLDEPLSGFDVQRRNGFMQLLREDLSKNFDQIIVISHIEALAEEFQNSLTLDSGRIIEVQR